MSDLDWEHWEGLLKQLEGKEMEGSGWKGILGGFLNKGLPWGARFMIRNWDACDIIEKLQSMYID